MAMGMGGTGGQGAAGAVGGQSQGGKSGKQMDRERQQRDSGMLDSGTQRHRNRAAEIARVGAATGTSTTPVGNTGVSPAGRVSSIHQGMVRDYQNIGNSDLENFGNTLAGMLGFNEQRPTLARALDRFNRTKDGEISDKRAGWGFDPAGLIGNALGSPFGAGLIAGPIANQISAYFDRPLEIGLGPDVFSGQISAPSFQANTNRLNADMASLGLGGSPGAVNPAGGPSTPTPGQGGVHPTGGAQNPGLAANPAQAQPGLKPMPAPQTIAPVPQPKPLTTTPYGWGQVTLPQPNYFMSQMT